MAYYVLGSGGAKYGPVDLTTLSGWVSQGRVLPETLIEDVGSGVKSPARAIKGLQFLGPIPGVSAPSTGTEGAALTDPLAAAMPQTMPPAPALHSNYLRPGMGTGGSQNNLFMPGVDSKWAGQKDISGQKSLFLPSVDSKWAWHGFACVGAAILCALFIAITHMYVGLYVSKILIFAVALPVFGVQRGYRGLRFNRPLAMLVIGLNVLALLGAIAIMVKGFFL